MLDEILETVITMLYDAIEGFFNALVFPTVKHLQTAIYTSLVFLLFSLVVELLFEKFVFVSWQEAGTCTVILFVMYGINSINQKDIRKISGSIVDKANKAKAKAKKTIKSAGGKKVKSKKK